MKKESLSFFVIVLTAVVTILSVLYIQSLRNVAKLTRAGEQAPTSSPSATPSASTYPLPKERTYVTTLALPAPKTTTGIPVDKAIQSRRSRRAYSDKAVTLGELSQMLWAGQGISDPQTGKRTVPSARESYSMTLFLVVRQAQGIEPGVYEYLPKTHSLGKVASLDVDSALKAAGVQEAAQKSPIVFLVASSFGKYQQVTKSPTVTATYMEAGHIGQNLYLEAESLGMATVAMAGFDSTKVGQALSIDPALTIQYIFPFGHPGQESIEE